MTAEHLAALQRRVAALHAMCTDADAPPFSPAAFAVLAGEWTSLRLNLSARGEWTHLCNTLGIDPDASLASLCKR